MTPRVVVTFIGGGGVKYAPVIWSFQDDEPGYEHPILGVALVCRLLKQPGGPLRVVVLGTPTSAWPQWLSAAGVPDAAAARPATDDEWSEQDLSSWSGKAATALGPQTVSLKVVPYGIDTGEQLRVLEAIVEAVPAGAELHIDVTYGMRSHPIIGALAALVARDACRARIGGVYYGALVLGRQTDGGPAQSKVHRLDGFLAVADWLAAFRTALATGDFGVFAGLFRKGGLDSREANLMSDAAFFRVAGRYNDSRARLFDFQAAVKNARTRGDLTVPARLTESALQLASVVGETAYQTLRNEASAALGRGDLVRASQLAYEAAQRVLKTKFDPDAQETLTQQYDDWFHGLPERQRVRQRGTHHAYHTIRMIRNVVTHADDTKRDIIARAAFASRSTCTKELITAIESFLPQSLDQWPFG